MQLGKILQTLKECQFSHANTFRINKKGTEKNEVLRVGSLFYRNFRQKKTQKFGHWGDVEDPARHSHAEHWVAAQCEPRRRLATPWMDAHGY